MFENGTIWYRFQWIPTYVCYAKKAGVRAILSTAFPSQAPYAVVQAKSAEEPCTPLTGGLYAQPYVPESWRKATNTVKGNTSYGWYITHSSNGSSTYEPSLPSVGSLKSYFSSYTSLRRRLLPARRTRCVHRPRRCKLLARCSIRLQYGT